MRRAILTIGLVILVLGTAQIAIADIDSNSIVNNGIEYYIQTDKAIYNLGENVEILYRVTNLTDVDVVLSWVIDDPLAYYDFRVTQGDNWIWRYPYMSGAMGMTGIPFAPYESKEFQTAWNMMNYNGTLLEEYDDFPVGPGIYDVVGEVALWPKVDRIPVNVTISIIPEPATLLLMAGGIAGLLIHNQRTTKN